MRVNQDESLWVVIPALNEAENLLSLVPEVVRHTTQLGVRATILIVDDGSTDSTNSVTRELMAQHPIVSCLALRRNFGKAEALRQGFTLALQNGATTLVMMDADGQDDPAELPRLLDADVAGHGVVTGARVVRHDRFVKRTTSRWYNAATRMVSGAPGRDFNSGFKALSAEAAREVLPMLYGELHRYITIIAYWRGYKVHEVEVSHHERLHGETKYGPARFWRGFMDLVTVRFLMSYESRPSHLFGGFGALMLFLGSIVLTYMTALRLSGETVGSRPALIAGVLLVLVGLQLLLFGLLAELVVYGRENRRTDPPARGRVITGSDSE